MSDFKKEIKYIVLKYKDIEAAGLSDKEKADMYRLINRIELARAQRLKPPLECVVVESDWRCYDKVWGMVEVEHNQDTAVGTEMTMPKEHEFASQVAYARTLEEYCEKQAAKLAAARAETAVERMRLAACGVVAMSNTPDSAAKAREMLPEYRSGSLEDVIRAVDSEMELREQLAAEQAKNVELREALHYSLGAWEYDGISDEHGSIFQEARSRCDATSDTSALQAIVKKAGEVMRERCLALREAHLVRSEAIHALPAVILEDLK